MELMSQKKLAQDAGDKPTTRETTSNRRVKAESNPSQAEPKKFRLMSQNLVEMSQIWSK